MNARVTCGFALVLALGCSSSATKVGQNSDPSQVSAALQALTARDQQVAVQCGEAVQRCEQQLPDAAPAAAVCERLAQHCADLQQHLDEVRSHVVGCLNGVQACVDHAPEQAQCSRDVTTCQPLAEGADEDRDTVLKCSEKVQACATRVASLPAAAAVSCENMAAACERVSALVKEAGNERANGNADAEEHAKNAHDAMDGVDDDADEADDADDDGAADVDDADEAGGHEGRGPADAGAGHAHQADQTESD